MLRIIRLYHVPLRVRGAVGVVLLSAAPFCALAATMSHQAATAFGGRLSSASYTSETAGAQGQPIGLLADTTNVWTRNIFNFAGFFHPGDDDLAMDTSGNGIPDAVDPDMDGDGISNVDELLGIWFGGLATDPRRADTDGNGSSDHEEWMAGTNPTDADSQFRITRVIYNSATDVRIRFRSVGGRQYELFRAQTIGALYQEAPIDGTEGAPGTGFFNESETEFIDVPFGQDYFYGVRLVP
ncbi:MAG TPA: hypothetical protein PKE12_02420 [Kiritimatiellia bacterium]|nr:hypothetical protein [Kiritimatiellia bacterium]